MANQYTDVMACYGAWPGQRATVFNKNPFKDGIR